MGACGSCLFVVTVCNELARVWKQNCMSCFEFFFFVFPFFLLAFVVKFICEQSLTLVLECLAIILLWLEVLSLGFEGKLGCGGSELGFVGCNVSREFFFPLV